MSIDVWLSTLQALHKLVTLDDSPRLSLEAALVCVQVMTFAGEIDKRIVAEETLDQVILMLKAQTTQLSFPFLDASGQSNHGGKKPDAGSLKLAVKLATGSCELMYLLKALVMKVNLEDGFILQVCALAYSALTVESIANSKQATSAVLSLQYASIAMLSSVFERFIKHRAVILDDFLSIINKLPSSKRQSKMYATPSVDDVSTFIRMSTALLLKLVQSCCGEDGQAEAQYKLAVGNCNFFLQSLIGQCTKSENAKELTLFLNNLVDDLLLLLHLPEWPAAEVALQLICKQLSGYLLNTSASKKKEPGYFSFQSLGILGRVLARVQSVQLETKRNPLVLPEHVDENTIGEGAHPTDAGQVTACACGRGANSVELMLDCDDCHRWFHAACIGVQETNLPKFWACDDCKMLDQLKRFTDVSLDRKDLVFRQLFLNFLVQEKLSYASRFCLYQCTSQNEAYGKLLVLPSGDELKNLPVLSRSATVELCKHIATSQHFGLCAVESTNFLTKSLLLILGKGQPTFRQRAIKALALVIEANPALMGEAFVKQAVELRVLDEAKSVREATVDLVGRYIIKDPALAAKYVGVLRERLKDAGVSVRKRVIKILRHLLLGSNNQQFKVDICTGFVERIADINEEDSIKELILQTFETVMFNFGPAMTSTKTPKRRKKMSPRAKTPMQLVATPSSATTNTPTTTVDLNDPEAMEKHALSIVDLVISTTNHEWLIQLVKELVEERDNKSVDKIVNALAEYLLKLEEGDAPLVRRLESGVALSQEKQLAGVLRTIYIFAMAKPSLAVPHLQLLYPYLKGENHVSNEVEVLTLVLEILVKSCVHIHSLDKERLANVQLDLEGLVYSQPSSVMVLALECMCVIIRLGIGDLIANRVCKKFANFLDKFKVLESFENCKPRVRSSAERALLGCGAICRHFSKIEPDDKHKVVLLLLHYCSLKRACDSNIRGTALRALGMVFVSTPKLVVDPEVGQPFYEALQGEDPHARMQVLQALIDLFTDFEKGTEDLSSLSTSRKVEGDQGESGLIGGIAQRVVEDVLRLVVGPRNELRITSIVLLGIMIRNGLCNPLRCIEAIITCLFDSNCHDTALQTILKVSSKNPEFIQQRAVKGICRSCEFRSQVFGDCDPIVHEKKGMLEPSFSYFARCYKHAFTAHPKQRSRFFQAMITQVMREESPLGLRIYLVKNLAALYYTITEEILYIVFAVNRVLSLKGSSLFDKLESVLANEAFDDFEELHKYVICV